MNYDSDSCKIITNLTYEKSNDFMKNIFEVQKRPFIIKSQIKNTSNYVIICPTHIDDYDRLRQITTEYGTYCKVNKKQQFLSRCYNSRSGFNDKLAILNKLWESHEITNPLCYQERINQIGDPCFETSLLFTIFVPTLNGTKAVGDIWLSHVELCNIHLYKGAVERSTMIDFKFQSKGIGQTAVKALYKLVIDEWHGKNITLIDAIGKKEQSNVQFTGVYSFVDYRNYKSLGNNIKSNNNVMGINKNMIIFRAINHNALMYNLLLGIEGIEDIKNIVSSLINVENTQEYSKALNNFLTKTT